MTVLACEGAYASMPIFAGRAGRIGQGGELRQSIRLNGERKMLNQKLLKSLRAFETLENVRLTVEEAEMGTWIPSIE